MMKHVEEGNPNRLSGGNENRKTSQEGIHHNDPAKNHRHVANSANHPTRKKSAGISDIQRELDRITHAADQHQQKPASISPFIAKPAPHPHSPKPSYHHETKHDSSKEQPEPHEAKAKGKSSEEPAPQGHGLHETKAKKHSFEEPVHHGHGPHETKAKKHSFEEPAPQGHAPHETKAKKHSFEEPVNHRHGPHETKAKKHSFEEPVNHGHGPHETKAKNHNFDEPAPHGHGPHETKPKINSFERHALSHEPAAKHHSSERHVLHPHETKVSSNSLQIPVPSVHHPKRKSPTPVKVVAKAPEVSEAQLYFTRSPSGIWPMPRNLGKHTPKQVEEYHDHALSINTESSEASDSSSLGIGFIKLKFMDSVYICPTKDVPRALLKTKSNRTYEILDYEGHIHFYASEQKGGCLDWFLGESRSFVIRVYDETGAIIFKFTRPMTCVICMLGVDSVFSCTHKVLCTYIHTNTLASIGKIQSIYNCCYPLYVIEDSRSIPQFIMNAPRCSNWLICRMSQIPEFPICDSDTGTQFGKIQLGYDGLDDAKIPNPDTVSVIFPPDCTPDIKACLLGAGFLTDVTYFQKRGVTCHRFLIYLIVTLFLGASLGGIIYAVIQKAL